MERVKIFYSWLSSKCREELENDICNWFIEMKNTIEVTQRLQSCNKSYIMITIFYKVKK